MSLPKAKSYFELMLPNTNKEVQRTFDQFYVEHEFARYKAQGIPEADILKFFHKAQLSGANPALDQIYLYVSNVKLPDGSYTKVGTIVFSYHYLSQKAKELLSSVHKNLWPITENTQADYFDPESGEFKKTSKSTSSITIEGITYSYTAWYPEYVQMDYKTGKPKKNWKNHVMMLDKCAKMGLWRSLFPEALTGYFAEEEMASYQTEEEIEEEAINKHKEDIIVEKHETIIESLQIKEEKKINSIEVESLVSSIKNNLGILTANLSVAEKGQRMFELLGIRSFKEIDKFDLDTLRAKNDLITQKVFDIKNEEIEKLMTQKNAVDSPKIDQDESPSYDDSDIPPEAYEDSIHLEPIEPEILPPETPKKRTSSKAGTTTKTNTNKPTFSLGV